MTRCSRTGLRFQSTPSGGKATGVAADARRRPRRFNPRLPGGRRPVPICFARLTGPDQFQSTPSGGKATGAAGAEPTDVEAFQSTPSGGKATDYIARAVAAWQRFNPRLPGGRRRGLLSSCSCLDRVSIHAFRGEGDVILNTYTTCTTSFNPRLPGGRRPGYRDGKVFLGEFQSTPSGGKATFARSRYHANALVSIHAFRGEGDVWLTHTRMI